MERISVSPNVREWYYFPIQMPVDKDGNGPAEVGLSVRIDYEVWDQLCNTWASYNNLPDAINEAMRLNEIYCGRQ